MKDLDAVVARVGHGELAERAKGDAGRPIELPVAGAVRAGRAKRAGGRAVCMKDLDAVVARVGHGELAGGAKGDAVGIA